MRPDGLHERFDRLFREPAGDEGPAQVSDDLSRCSLKLRLDLLRLEHGVALHRPFDKHSEESEHLRGKI